MSRWTWRSFRQDKEVHHTVCEGTRELEPLVWGWNAVVHSDSAVDRYGWKQNGFHVASRLVKLPPVCRPQRLPGSRRLGVGRMSIFFYWCPSYFLRLDLIEPESCHWLDHHPVSSGHPFLTSLELQTCAITTGFYVGTGDLNLYFPTCSAGIL